MQNSIHQTSIDRFDTLEEKFMVDKETISSNLHKTIEEKDEIIIALNDKIKRLESTIKQFESRPFSPKAKIISKPKTKEISLLTSPKTPKTNGNFVSTNTQLMKKRHSNFIKELAQNIYKPKLNIKFETFSPRTYSPKHNNKNNGVHHRVITSPNTISNLCEENGGVLNHLSSIRERTKSVLDQYRQTNTSLIIKIRSMNNSELIS